MNTRRKILLFSLGLLWGIQAEASLLLRLEGRALYDTDTNLTWLSDANYAKTSGFDADGRLNWAEANAWVDNLDIGGFTDWRLPTSLQPDPHCDYQSYVGSYGYHCIGSELGNLFSNVLGGQNGQSITSVHNANYDLLTHLQNNFYWTSTLNNVQGEYAWGLSFADGYQSRAGLLGGGYVWAVRNGDTLGSDVPAPGGLSMIFLSLALIGIVRRNMATETHSG
jgi:hypothetical protein